MACIYMAPKALWSHSGEFEGGWHGACDASIKRVESGSPALGVGSTSHWVTAGECRGSTRNWAGCCCLSAAPSCLPAMPLCPEPGCGLKPLQTFPPVTLGVGHFVSVTSKVPEYLVSVHVQILKRQYFTILPC